MKQIINGKLYNTDTAKKIGEFESDYPKDSFRFFSETLYQKQNGEYFLFGQGQAESKYGKKTPQGKISWAKIKPLSYEQSYQWALKNLSADEFMQNFGEVEE